ncbi:hypothetical protein ASG54_12990 [Aureimonas sp. Leaf460]|nr:hypothetical protein ASG54_12990 [Aureimonas sp. Leaf460]
MTESHGTIINAAGASITSRPFDETHDDGCESIVSADEDDRMNDGDKPGGVRPETTKEKSERLKAARLQAERDKDTRIERATRKAIARRKVLGDGKG